VVASFVGMGASVRLSIWPQPTIMSDGTGIRDALWPYWTWRRGASTYYGTGITTLPTSRTVTGTTPSRTISAVDSMREL
jgi:hypothetical protein